MALGLSTSSLSGKMSELTSSVEAFNGVSMDKSKTMFKDCLGTEFPFDVVEAVENYVDKLSTALNSSLDAVLCGNAVNNLGKATTDLIDTASGSANSVMDLFSSSESSDKGLTNHTITSNDWIKTYSGDDAEQLKKTIILISGNIGADKVELSAEGSYTDNKDGTASATLTVTVEVDRLYRGPNDGQSKDTDAENTLEPVSGTFKYSDKNENFFIFGKTFLSFDSVTIPLSSNSDITLKIGGSVFNDNTISVNISELTFTNNWSDVNVGLTSAQSEASEESTASAINQAKKQALNALKSDFMQSSELDTAMDAQLDKLGDSIPALAGIDKSNVKGAVKTMVADNAIALANGDSLSIDKEITKTIASEVTASSINAGLSKLGIDASISSDCTKELLDSAIALLPDATLDNPFGGMDDCISYDDAYSYAKGVVSDLQQKFDKLLSKDCIQAVNNSYDICSSNMASTTGNIVDYSKARTIKMPTGFAG